MIAFPQYFALSFGEFGSQQVGTSTGCCSESELWQGGTWCPLPVLAC